MGVLILADPWDSGWWLRRKVGGMRDEFSNLKALELCLQQEVKTIEFATFLC